MEDNTTKTVEIKDILDVNLVISHRNNKPCLEIRRVTTDPNIIKQVIKSAFYENPIIVQPVFSNRIRSINTLIEKGIMYRKGDSYQFTI